MTIEKARDYLRLDGTEDDGVVESLLLSAEQVCLDVSRMPKEEFEKSDICQGAVLYALGYLYEHREKADHHDLVITLRNYLFAEREGVF